MINFKKTITILSFLLLLPACMTTKKETLINLSLNYSQDSGPKFNIKDYLNGDLEGWGYFEDEKGMVTKRVVAQVSGDWEEDNGTIKRNFVIDGKKKDSRTWLITMDKNDFSAVGHDVIGSAKGQQYKGLSQMIYKIKMKFDGLNQDTDVVETTYNIDNKSSISIFEFKVGKKNMGKLVLSLHKVSDKKNIKTSSLDKETIKTESQAESE